MYCPNLDQKYKCPEKVFWLLEQFDSKAPGGQIYMPKDSKHFALKVLCSALSQPNVRNQT